MEGKKRTKGRLSGFTLVEILISFVVVAVVGTAIITAYLAAFRSIDLARARMTAVSLANEKMETYRNMPYTDLGLSAGAGGSIPAGTIEQVVEGAFNNINLTVETKIEYVDDEFDGTLSAGTDLVPQDYKKIEIIVKKTGRSGTLARLVTNISSKTQGTPAGYGNVYICVYTESGTPVEGATVTLSNTLDPTWGPEDALTGPDGCAVFSAPQDCNHPSYHVVATYPAYSTDLTFENIAPNPTIPIQPDFPVCEDEVSTQTLSIDTLASLTINFLNSSGNAYPGNVEFWIEGAKKIADNPSDNSPVYKCSEEAPDWTDDPYIENSRCTRSWTATNVGGPTGSTFYTFDDLEFDNYKIYTSKPPNNISFGGGPTKDLTTIDYMQEFYLGAGETKTVNATLTLANNQPRIWRVNPTVANPGNINMEVVGYSFASRNPQAKLILASNPTVEKAGTITLTAENLPSDNILKRDHFEVRFDGVTDIGKWDLQVTTTTGTVLQKNALEIIN